MKRRIAMVGAVGVFTLTLAPMSAQAAESGEATVSVLHAVPGLTVDVYANGDELIPDFKPARSRRRSRSLPAATTPRSSRTATTRPLPIRPSRPTV
jgi:hypothetical protein